MTAGRAMGPGFSGSMATTAPVSDRLYHPGVMLEQLVPSLGVAQGTDRWGMKPGRVNMDILYGGCAMHHVAIWSV